MRIILWIIVGVALCSALFFLQPAGEDLWPQANAAGIAVLIYLVSLGIYTLRKPIPRTMAFLIALMFLIGGTSVALTWRTQQRMSQYQRKQLVLISQKIHEGWMRAISHDTLMTAFRSYHGGVSGEPRSMAAAFTEKFPSAVPGGRVRLKRLGESDDSTFFHVNELSDSSVVLTGRVSYVHGRNPDFVNIDGRRGMIQLRATMTPKGIEYDKEN